VNRQLLVSTDVERDTGVMVSKSLKPSAQRTKAAWTTLIVLGQINSVFHFATQLIDNKGYLERKQMRAVRTVSGLKWTTYEERLKELGLTYLD
jgi:hypothetical protein